MSLLSELLPPHCLLCGDFAAERLALCHGCRGDLRTNRHACSRCAEPLPATGAAHPELSVCGRCLWHPPAFSAIHVPYRYVAPLDWLLHRCKFSGDLAAGRALGELLAGALLPVLPPIDVIVPVPLHPSRLRQRGYNQAAELARPLARALRAPICHSALRRGGSATPQMQLPARDRRGNVQRAFRVNRRLAGEHVLLLDDVVTTASTVSEAARTLAATPEARSITVAALARA